MNSPSTFVHRTVGDPPWAAVVSFRRIALIDHDHVQAMGDALFAFQETHPDWHLVLDFSGLQAISSAMLGKLITLHRRVERAGRKLALCQLEGAVADAFSSSRLDDYLIILPDPAAALDWIGEG